jgi:hypothetical protein
LPEDFDIFASMSFKGDRFNGRFIPVDALPAISCYQEALIQMAKAIWHEENPERDRLPKGFSKAFELGLRDIGDGSKVAYLPRRENSDDQFFPDFSPSSIFLQAQERIAQTVISANNNRKIDPLPESVIAPIEKILRSITPDEHISIDPIAEGRRRFGSFQISEKSVAAIAAQSRIRNKKRLDGVGFVVASSEAPPSIKVISPNGSFLYPIAWEDLRSNANLAIGSVVSFAVNVETNAIGEITNFLSPEAISPTIRSSRTDRMQSRIEGLLTLKPGWLDGKGSIPTKQTAMRSSDFAIYFGRTDLDVSVFLHEEGGIQFEWVNDMIALSLLIESDMFLLGASDLRSDAYREKSFKGISLPLLRAISQPETFVGRQHD